MTAPSLELISGKLKTSLFQEGNYMWFPIGNDTIGTDRPTNFKIYIEEVKEIFYK